MNLQLQQIDSDQPGSEMLALAERLYPIHRAVTGDGVRESLAILQEHVPLKIYEVPSGTQVFDWKVPREWKIRDAYIKDAGGEKVVDYRCSNLHVVSCSQPVKETLCWNELKRHVHTLPDFPDWIPFRTAHLRDTWGFCMSHRQYLQLDRQPQREYEVYIDSTLHDGSLTYGEVYLPGATPNEVLISTHVCHPSLANDNLSGIVVATQIIKALQSADRRYSYRFIFVPATIGAITWLALNESRLRYVSHGLVLTVLGDAGKSTYKTSRRGDAEVDRVAAHVLRHSGTEFEIRPFEPIGYDERQFCSPGIDLPMGVLMRTPNGEYPEYHTSADNLQMLDAHSLTDSLTKCLSIFDALEHNRRYLNLRPKCEPQLGHHGLYRAFGEADNGSDLQRAVLWVLNLSDGNHWLLDIAERADLKFDLINQAAELLEQKGLLRLIDSADRARPAAETKPNFATDRD